MIRLDRRKEGRLLGGRQLREGKIELGIKRIGVGMMEILGRSAGR